MCLYIREALSTVGRHGRLLLLTAALVSIAQMLPLIGTAASVWHPTIGSVLHFVFHVTSWLVTVSAPIYAYQKIMGRYSGMKNTIIQGIFAAIAGIIWAVAFVSILATLSVTLAITVVGVVLIPVVWLAAVVYFAKAIYITYVAAMGYDPVEIVEKIWKARLGVVWRAIFGQMILSIPLLALFIIAFSPILAYITVKTLPAAMNVSTAELMNALGSIPVLGSLFSQTMLNPVTLSLSGITAVITSMALVMLMWVFPLVSGKDAVGE